MNVVYEFTALLQKLSFSYLNDYTHARTITFITDITNAIQILQKERK